MISALDSGDRASTDAALQETPIRKPPGLSILQMAGTDTGATWMVEQLVGLRARGYSVHAAIVGNGPLAQKLAQNHIPYTAFSFGLCWAPQQLPTFVRQVLELSRFIGEQKFDIVHYHLLNSMFLGRLAAWIADCPTRITMVAGPTYMEAPGFRLIEQLTCWMDSAVIGSCAFTNELYGLAGIPPKKQELVYYGPDAKQFDPQSADGNRVRFELGIPADSPLVGMVAYFYPKIPKSRIHPKYLWGKSIKNHECFIAAMPDILAKIPDARFLIVGQGWGEAGERYVAELKEQAVSAGLSDAVIFAGHRTDIPDVLAAFDVSVQCSNSENLGGTIESLLMSKPLVVTNVGGLIDSVQNEKTGLVVERDDHKGLANAIIRLLENKSFASQLGASGRKLMLERFTLNTTVERLDDIYRRRAQGKKGYRTLVASLRRLLGVPIAVALGLYFSGHDVELTDLNADTSNPVLALKIVCKQLLSLIRKRIAQHFGK